MTRHSTGESALGLAYILKVAFLALYKVYHIRGDTISVLGYIVAFMVGFREDYVLMRHMVTTLTEAGAARC